MDIVSKRYEEWKNRVDVGEMSEEEKTDSFYTELKFGTGGLRGKIGNGTNRMNFQTVSRATLGLAEYLNQNFEKPSVAIAYDSRKFSKEFAKLSAEIMSFKNVEVYLFDTLMPTPVLSFAVRELKTSAGIVVTASHNPKEYNGYKVYNEKGCQITDEAAEKITFEIERSGYFDSFSPDEKRIHLLSGDFVKSFVDKVCEYSLFDITESNSPTIVYTPLCGTGRVPVGMMFDRIGEKKVKIVGEQEFPDENFTTCPYPNPEENEAMALAYRDAERYDAELILATDPDADRMGVAERGKNGDIRRFSGNETGLLLLDFILKRKEERGENLENKYIIKTIVSSDMGRKIAKKHGIKCFDVLTGFKYIGEKMDAEKSEDFLFGFEESCGYLIGAFARDKDSIGALMLLSEAKAYYKSKNKTLSLRMNELYEEYGFSATKLNSKLFEGINGLAEKERILCGIRENPFTEINDEKVLSFKDYTKGIDGLPRSNVMEFSGNGFKFIIRPSGTEPKLKVYYFADGKTQEEADKKLSIIESVVESRLK